MAGATSCLGADPGVGPCPGRTAGFVDEGEGCLRREQARQEAEAPEPARPQRQQLSRLAAMPPDAAEPSGVCGSAVEVDPTFLQFGAVGTDAASRSMMFALVTSSSADYSMSVAREYPYTSSSPTTLCMSSSPSWTSLTEAWRTALGLQPGRLVPESAHE